MTKSATTLDDLTKNQRLVFDTLQRETGPMTAYKILDDLKPAGLRAPLQVYRALDKLVEKGMVHRLESLNSFVACQHDDCGSHDAQAFSICQKCSAVEEFTNAQLEGVLLSMARQSGFNLDESTVELRGVCERCTGDAPKVQ